MPSTNHDLSFEERSIVYQVEIGRYVPEPAGVRQWSATHNFTHEHIHKNIDSAIAECAQLRLQATESVYKGIRQKPIYRVKQIERTASIVNY